MSRKKEQEKIEKIRKYILETGYPTEIEIGNILRKDGWLVGNQWPYRDKESNKIRTVDVLAMKMRLQPPKLGFSLLIECKKSTKHEWVFHTQEKEREFLPALTTFADFIEKLAPLLGEELMDFSPNEIMATKLSGLHILDKDIKIGVFNVIPSSKNRDDFHDANNQIISSLEGLSEGMKSFIVFPTIVFDGELFEFYQDNKQTNVLPINHIQFLSFKRDMTAFLIDVVRKTHFSEHLRVINRDLYILTELLKIKGVIK